MATSVEEKIILQNSSAASEIVEPLKEEEIVSSPLSFDENELVPPGSSSSFSTTEQEKLIEEKEEPRKNETRTFGLGNLHCLPDWLIMNIFGLLDVNDLVNASYVSKAFYIYSEEDEIWHRICLLKNKCDFTWKGNWKRTVLMPRDKEPTRPQFKLTVGDFYSDHLYAQWYRGHVPISYFSQLPERPPAKCVERRSNLSYDEFVEEYVKKNKPVILTDVVTKWPAWIRKSWTKEALIKRFGDTEFRVDQTDSDGKKCYMKLGDYFKYGECNNDEDPIYVFCPFYSINAPTLLGDYEVADYFKGDLLACMSDEDRPFYRWVVIGCPRSGSPFHLDPFKTSAWNALLTGRKRWTLYPPGFIPPGMEADYDDDGLVDYSGDEPIKWFLEHYPNVMRLPQEMHPIECIQEAGELIYVPTNWWHMVLNLTESVAVTQNFCDEHNFRWVYEDMKLDSDHRKMHATWSEKLMMIRPDLMELVSVRSDFHKIREKRIAKQEKKRRKKLKKELKNQEKLLQRWREGSQDCLMTTNDGIEPSTHSNNNNDNDEKVGTNFIDSVYGDTNYWKSPLPKLEEEEESKQEGSPTKRLEILKLHLPEKQPRSETSSRSNEFFNDTNYWRTPIYNDLIVD